MNDTLWQVYLHCQFPLLSVSSHLSFLSGDSRQQAAALRRVFDSFIMAFHSFPIPPFSQFSTQHQMFPPFQMFQVKWLLTKEKIHSKYSLKFGILSHAVFPHFQYSLIFSNPSYSVFPYVYYSLMFSVQFSLIFPSSTSVNSF